MVDIHAGRESDAKAGSEIPSLVSQLRLAITTGVDKEFLRSNELTLLEVTAAQFVILKNVLKGNAESACSLCKLLDYDRGAMSRMIDRLESRGLLRRVPVAHTRRSVALQVTAAGEAAFPLMAFCVARVLEKLSKGISKGQLRQTEDVLRRMLENA